MIGIGSLHYTAYSLMYVSSGLKKLRALHQLLANVIAILRHRVNNGAIDHTHTE